LSIVITLELLPYLGHYPQPHSIFIKMVGIKSVKSFPQFEKVEAF